MPSISGVSIGQIKLWLRERVSPKLYAHSLRVMQQSQKIADDLDLNFDKAAIGGLLHDSAKELPGERQVELAEEFGIERDFTDNIVQEDLHARVGAFLVRRDLEIEDPEILAAIWCHTFGPSGIDEIIPNKGKQIEIRQGKIHLAVMVGDDTEPERAPKAIKKIEKALRKRGLEEAALKTLDLKLFKILDKGYFIHPLHLEARNNLLFELKENNKEES